MQGGGAWGRVNAGQDLKGDDPSSLMPPLTSEARARGPKAGGREGRPAGEAVRWLRGGAQTGEGTWERPATMCELYSKQDTLALRRRHIG